jgi:hypothetical protein
VQYRSGQVEGLFAGQRAGVALHFTISDMATHPWLTLIALSAAAGCLAALAVRGRPALALAAVVPWLGVLGWLLYLEYGRPYQGGGASLWPIAPLFGGTVAACTGVVAAALIRWLTGAAFRR